MEALNERGLLLRNAPHLVRDLAFVVPNYQWWEAPFYGIGLKVYDLLTGKYGFARSLLLSPDDVLARRSRALCLNARAALDMAPAVARLLAAELNREDAWQQRQLAEFREIAGCFTVN